MELILDLVIGFIILVVIIFIVSGEGDIFVEVINVLFNPKGYSNPFNSYNISIKTEKESFQPPNDIPYAESKRSPEDEIHLGCRVELVCMNDPYTRLIPGDKGKVQFVDDIGTIHVKWDNGSSLGIAYGVDHIKKL